MTSPWQPPDPTATPTAAEPQYGELAPPGYTPPAQPAPVYYRAPRVERRPRTADVAITCILLTIGLVSMLLALTLPPQLATVATQVGAKYGVENIATGGLVGYGVGIVISQVALYLAALGIAIPLMVKRRVAFWVPLTAGVLAAIIFWTLFVAALLSDPRLWAAVQARQ